MPTREQRARKMGVTVDQLPADTRGKHGNHVRGQQHPRWNHGMATHEDGYLKVRVGVEHPLADPNGYAYLHLLVWASAGRPLPGPDELLDHHDENKQNNQIGNLRLMTRSAHAQRHSDLRGRAAHGQFPKLGGSNPRGHHLAVLDGVRHVEMPVVDAAITMQLNRSTP